ncbi:Major Facilitator Superfamily protein [Oceanobacillus limi]|uniref:Major Facilitator Superfamily protein n=1 Tax=Oceanobacillus limi TaxID=930131 RepID=A0A1H9Y4M9_9BACI|nr:MFS transporter [Oceanobacillus limi]SES63641.1 Major Facilitator Superfamily protein [Oceanobacillus limi]
MMLKWVVRSQSVLLFGTGLVFPFYIVFLSESGASFSEFGLAYGLFTVSAALVHHWVGRYSDLFGRKIFLLVSAWGNAIVYLVFPVVQEMLAVYIIQVVLGILGALQKTSEKALVADFTDGSNRGVLIGRYHFWISLWSGAAVMVSGFLIDLLTLSVIFYLGSFICFLSGVLTLFIQEEKELGS